MRQQKQMRGFTLIEMVVSMVVIGILASVGAVVIANGVEAYNATTTAMETLAKLRYATERMGREIRSMEYNGGAYQLSTSYPSDTTMQFTRSDGTQVTIAQSGASITMEYDSISGGARTLTDQVGAFSLNYYQDDGTNATGAANVAFVEINLTLTQNSASYPQRTMVALRNSE